MAMPAARHSDVTDEVHLPHPPCAETAHYRPTSNKTLLLSHYARPITHTFMIWCHHHTGAGGGVLGGKQGGKMNSTRQLMALPKGVK